MPTEPLLLAIDQGTTSSRAIVFDRAANIHAQAQSEFPQHYPQDGWVEHEPEDLWRTSLAVARQALARAEAAGGRVAAIGIANQRETTLVWERASGRPIGRAIVWQDRRTADHCRRLKAEGAEAMIRERTGLVLDPYFSASKAAYLVDAAGAGAAARAGALAFGTVDSFLISKLTGGRVHATDATNASRTSLFDIARVRWDEDLCRLFGVAPAMLPVVKDCADDFGETDPSLFGRAIPIAGVAGDQQAAAIGQACWSPGDIKSTYGTGCFMLVNTGRDIVRSRNNLLSTVASRLNGETRYAVEGSIFIAGAAIQWLRDGLKIIASAAESEALARSVADSGGVYLVPAFTGLGAPHWAPDARGAIYGLTRAAGRAEIVRAALESVVYQTADLLDAMRADGARPKALRVDGGMAANDWLLATMADMLDLPVERPAVMETTALGAALLAGLRIGLYASPEEAGAVWRRTARFEPSLAAEAREKSLAGWRRAVRRTLME